jgi:SHS family sialic acid transporter-like MFS transporter
MTTSNPPPAPMHPAAPPASRFSRQIILAAAFFGWMFSGFQMAVMTLASRAATTEFLRSGMVSPTQPWSLARLGVFSWGERPAKSGEAPVFISIRDGTLDPVTTSDEEVALRAIAAKWLSWYNAAFLFGAAGGGLVFGWLGDYLGRVRAMAASIFCFSVFSLIGYWAVTPEQLLLLRLLCGAGVGGMWPTGVALASEAWPDASRPLVSGILGTAANVGLVILNGLGWWMPVTPAAWRWTLLVCATPVLLAPLVWFGVPESQRWLAARKEQVAAGQRVWLGTVFGPKLVHRTLLGIALGTIPLLGGWGATQWLIPWADQVRGAADPRAKALAGVLRSGGAAVGSLLGGGLASLLGRRATYFVISLLSLAIGEYLYLFASPGDAHFGALVFLLGFVSTIFFGWLPLYLPELFPTYARAAGAGVSFNFGRILTAAGVLAAGWITYQFGDDYGRAGSVTTLVYALGMVVILFAPDTTRQRWDEASPTKVDSAR